MFPRAAGSVGQVRPDSMRRAAWRPGSSWIRASPVHVPGVIFRLTASRCQGVFVALAIDSRQGAGYRMI
eukprot:13984732-Alexandrium_andersonii.AAC.1